jgi:serine protease inhibitor
MISGSRLNMKEIKSDEELKHLRKPCQQMHGLLSERKCKSEEKLNEPHDKKRVISKRRCLSSDSLIRRIRETTLIEKNILFKENTGPLASLINEFAFAFYKRSCHKVNKNVLFSPLGIFSILHMCYSCSPNEHELELKRLLRFDKMLISRKEHLELTFALLCDKISQTFNEQKQRQKDKPPHCCGYIYQNKMFVIDGFLKSSYKDKLASYFDLHVHENTVDLYGRNQVLLERLVNTSIKKRMLHYNALSDKERAKRTPSTLLDKYDYTNIFLNINTLIDFTCEWENRFEQIKKKGFFLTADKAKIRASFMQLEAKLKYAKSPRGMPLKICDIPFICSSFVLTVLMPNENFMNEIESKLDYKLFSDLVDSMQDKRVKIDLPMFDIKDEYDIRRVLREMNATLLDNFDSVSHGVCLDKAFYSSSIYVNHKLVSSTAKTDFLLSRSEEKSLKLCLDHPSDEFNCERPFLFFIRELNTKLILFMGKLMVPVTEN